MASLLASAGPAASDPASESFLRARRTWLDPESLGQNGDGVIHTLHLGWSIPLGSRVRLLAALPLAFADLEETVRDEATGDPPKQRLEGDALGNPYLGLDLPAKRGAARLGLRGGARGWYPVDDRQDTEFFLLVGADLAPWDGDWAPTLFSDGRPDAGARESWYQMAGLGI